MSAARKSDAATREVCVAACVLGDARKSTAATAELSEQGELFPIDEQELSDEQWLRTMFARFGECGQ
jgi:hypothetical protein